MTKSMKEKQQLLKKALFVSIFLAIALASFIFYELANPVDEKFGGVFRDSDSKLKVRAMYSISKPVVTRDALLQWAVLAVTSANNFDPENYKEWLAQVTKTFFTPEGGAAFMDSLNKSGALDRVTKDRVIVTAVVQGAPVLLKQGILNYGLFDRKYTWKVQVPLLIAYQAAGADIEKKEVIVTLTIVEMPTWYSEQGIGIQQYIAAKA